MSHPFVEVVAALGVAVVVGVGTFLVLPEPAARAPAVTVELEGGGATTVRATPASAMTPSERVDALQRQLAAISAEHKRLAAEVRDIAAKARTRDAKSGGGAP